jgi:hypothetical protein
MEQLQELAGTHFTSFTTCFTGTNAQILRLRSDGAAAGSSQALSLLALLLALLVQTHKYWRCAPALLHMPAVMQALSLLALLLALLVQTRKY